MAAALKALFAPTMAADDTLAKVDEMLPLPDGSTAEAKYLLSKLTPWSEDEALNAKTRRRVKRIVSRLNEAYPGLDLTAPVVEETTPAPAAKAFGDLDARTAAAHFTAARSASEVENVLNCLVSPNAESKTDTDWQALKEVLFKLLANRYITNKNIRRRISRLIYVIASENDLQRLNEFKKESQEVTAKATASAATTRSARLQQQTALQADSRQNFTTASTANRNAAKVAQPATKAITPAEPAVAVPAIPLVVKSIADCLAELSSAANTTDVDAAISNVSANSQGTPTDRAELKSTLEKLSEDVSLVSNTKIKRKVQRLIKTLEGVTEEAAVASAPATTSSVAITGKKPAPAVSTAGPTVAASSVTADAGGIAGIVQQLKDVHSAEQLDSVLVTLDMRTVLPESTDGAENGGTNGEGVQHRRLLKRTIEQVLAQDDVSASMNAKVRRRVSRITSALTTDGDDAEEPAAAPDATATQSSFADARISGMGLTIPSTGAVVNATVKKVPYVVFVGNLSYDTTAPDIEQHLRETAALEGPIKVRLRTNPETQQSTGVAFVDLEGARELHQCVAAAHHSTLHGRIINVEKSCGGRNKTGRSEKIASKRTEQKQRAEEAVNRVLAQYEQRGVLQGVHKWGPTLKDSVHAHSAAHLTQVSTLLAVYLVVLLSSKQLHCSAMSVVACTAELCSVFAGSIVTCKSNCGGVSYM
jgi:hypothetical protein